MGKARAAERELYTTKIIKGGALVDDTISALAAWDLHQPAEANLDRFQRSNVLAKGSRRRLADVLTVLRRRYVTSPDMLTGLVKLAHGDFPATQLIPLLYTQTALADRLVFDFVVDFIRPRSFGSMREISTVETRSWLLDRSAGGRTDGRWSPATANRVAQGLLSTLRDFGLLQGKVRKRVAAMHLPLHSFAFLAFVLWSRTGAPRRLFQDPAWQLFFLERGGLERLFAEAHQEGLLQYQAAGTIVRLDFPAQSVEEYARVLVGGGHRYVGGRPASVPA